MCNTQCEFCANLRISSGDWVDYGSTRVQLPDEWDCDGDWPMPLFDNGGIERTIEDAFSGRRFNCPVFVPREMAQCPKHGDYPINEPCWKCLDEQMGEPDA